MPFDPVDPKQSLPSLEKGILRYWKEEDVFKRSIHKRSEGENFSFYDGPPFATGLPHYGHLLAGTIKDVIPRYQTMRGQRVERRFGWDCHGLPVENLIEQEQNLQSRKDIEAMGVRAFNDLCRASVMRYTKEWRETVERMGRWVDMDYDYRTMDPDYMESIWWVFSELYRKGLVYEGHKSMHVCPRCVTPLSNFEVTLGYKEITDHAVTVQFELEDEPDTFVLAWTTTPWTLPGNLFLAVHPNVPYVRVRSGVATYILAEARVAAVFGERDHEIIGRIKASDLIGRHYEPLFPYFALEYAKLNAFRIVPGDFVTTEEGTGIVHIATGFGEDDYQVGKRENVAVLQHVTMEGRFTEAVTDFAGELVKPAGDPAKTDRKVAAWLESHGKLFSSSPYTHSYPHCWRCDTPLLNYTTSSWFVAVTKIKEDLLTNNAETEWVPAHIRDGRFGKWLENARDWAISRTRYWGTPLPIWREGTVPGGTVPRVGDITIIGSRDDLIARQRIRFTKVTVLRHGESEGNLVPVYQGNLPGTKLTREGKRQAKKAGKFLQDGVPDVIYCSPLARTQETAEIIGKATGAEVIVDERLREVTFGEHEGKTVDFSDLSFVKARRAHKLDTRKPESIYHFEGMETWGSVRTRIGEFMRDVLPKHRSEHILVVTHADPLMNIRHFFTQEDPMKLSHQPYPTFATPETYYFDHDRGAQLDLHKDTADEIAWMGSSSQASVELTLVRHGETEWNKNGLIQGHVEIPLNDRGREQAEILGKKLRGKPFEVIIASDLPRAMETATILAKALGMTHIERWRELRERDVGNWGGKDRAAVARAHPFVRDSNNYAVHHETPEGGESLSEFLRRGKRACERILEKFPGKRVLVVAHSGSIQAMRIFAENLSYSEALRMTVPHADPQRLTLHPLVQRVPEVLDCWFESGSMPYAQSHYPFAFAHHSDKRPPGFPADFIAEGLDQTRGWFYTLMVLSTALFDDPAFRHCVVNGIVLAEDGKKMSKRLKNYPEPTEVAERQGADAVRFTLMHSPAVRAEDLRFSEILVEQTVRSVLLPLWNAYSFFVTYANACDFEPVLKRRASDRPLDRWIRAEVQDLVNRMTAELERYDLSATCEEIFTTIDALTNWYIRLSRKRFAGKNPGEQHDALMTLYDVLMTLSQLLAPFCPFITDAIYLNLVPEDHASVHLSDWPDVRELSKEEHALLEKTRLLKRIVSLGLTARSHAKVKVRQPLSEATVALPPSMSKRARFSEEDVALLRQELNVKEILFTDDPSDVAESYAFVNARKVGPRLGPRVQEIIAAGKAGDFTVEEDGRIRILEETFVSDEAWVTYRGKEGHDVASEGGIVVSLDTNVTEDLRLEGLARELVRTIQVLRKESGLTFTDRIALNVTGVDEVMRKFGDAIAEEVRATRCPNDGEEHRTTLEGQPVTIRLQKL